MDETAYAALLSSAPQNKLGGFLYSAIRVVAGPCNNRFPFDSLQSIHHAGVPHRDPSEYSVKDYQASSLPNIASV